MYPGIRGRVAIVTGSGRGIGRSIALCLSREGADVVLNFKKHADEAAATERLILGQGGRCTVVQADVSTPEGVARLFEESSKLGPAEILVNSAGLGLASPATSITAEMWSKQIDTNLRSAFMCSAKFLASMKGSWGRIVNMSSVSGIHGAPLLSVYAAAKAGLIGLSKALASEAPRGVTVNAVAPGVVKTKMGESLLRYLGKDEKSWAETHTTTGRLVTSDEVAELVTFVCSDFGSSITGQVLVIDGGQEIIQTRDFFAR